MKGFKKQQKKGKGGKHAPNPQTQVSQAFTPSHKSFKKLAIAVVVLIVAGLVGWQVYVYLDKKQDEKKVSSECSKVLISDQTALDLKNPAPTTLKPTVDKIKERADYSQDPSCLYVVTTYYINVSDAANARTNYDLLVKTYNSKIGYVDSIKYGAMAPDQLKQVVEYVESQQAAVEKSSKVIKP